MDGRNNPVHLDFANPIDSAPFPVGHTFLNPPVIRPKDFEIRILILAPGA